MQELKTKKLFYNKWPYKIETYIRGASRVHYSGPTKTILWCQGVERIDHWENEYSFWGARRNQGIDKTELAKFAKAVTPYLTRKKEIQIRCEGAHLNLFTADKSIVDNIKKDLYPWIRAITAPVDDNELQFLLDNGHKKVLCNQLPYNKYKYKVFFNTSFESAQRKNFYKWIERYDDRIDFPESVERWLLSNRTYMQDPFIYIEDEKMLSMALLYVGNNVKKVQEFIPRDKINT